MRWYGSSRLAHKPPAYMVERISDLGYVTELSQKSPSSARSVLDGVIEQLSTNMDDDYVDDLKSASEIMLDNPQKARNLIDIVAAFMRADKEKYDLEKNLPWKMRRYRL